MKRLVLFVMIVGILASCAPLETLKHIPKEENFYGIDFRRYAEKGFYFTPEKYNDKYEPVGLVEYVIYPEKNYIMVGFRKNPDYDLGNKESENYIKNYDWVSNKMYIQEAVDSIYNKCTSMGANAIMNFKFESAEKSYSGIKNPTWVFGYRLTGFAIKRLDE